MAKRMGYAIETTKNKKGKIKEVHISHRQYPLADKGYDNFQELNIKIRKLIKYTDIEIYWIRDNWNGTGYDPICRTKMQLDEEFFNFAISDDNVRQIAVQLVQKLRHAIENTDERNECFYATYYFPVL